MWPWPKALELRNLQIGKTGRTVLIRYWFSNWSDQSVGVAACTNALSHTRKYSLRMSKKLFYHHYTIIHSRSTNFTRVRISLDWYCWRFGSRQIYSLGGSPSKRKWLVTLLGWRFTFVFLVFTQNQIKSFINFAVFWVARELLHE